jgi:hypothetical protein
MACIDPEELYVRLRDELLRELRPAWWEQWALVVIISTTAGAFIGALLSALEIL